MNNNQQEQAAFMSQAFVREDLESDEQK